MKSGRPGVAPNFNFLGQLLDFEQTLMNQTDKKPIVDTNQIDANNLGPIQNRIESDDELKNNSKLDYSICLDQKLGKKRDRPTYLNLSKINLIKNIDLIQTLSDDPIISPTTIDDNVHFDDDDDDNQSDKLASITPTKGKRSRTSLILFDFPKSTLNALLPSPCTGLSKLEISSPLSSPQNLSMNHPIGNLKSCYYYSKNKNDKIQSFLDNSFTNLTSLKFEPCFVVGDRGWLDSTSGGGRGSIRRTQSNLGSTKCSIGLGKNLISNYQSAPTTPGHHQSVGEKNVLNKQMVVVERDEESIDDYPKSSILISNEENDSKLDKDEHHQGQVVEHPIVSSNLVPISSSLAAQTTIHMSHSAPSKLYSFIEHMFLTDQTLNKPKRPLTYSFSTNKSSIIRSPVKVGL